MQTCEDKTHVCQWAMLSAMLKPLSPGKDPYNDEGKLEVDFVDPWHPVFFWLACLSEL